MLRRRRAHIRRALLLTFALTCAAPLSLATPAAADSCQGITCMGKNPVTMGCDWDAQLVSETDDPPSGTVAVTVKLFHSATCGATWAKVTVDPTNTSLYQQYATIFYVPQLGGSEASYSGGLVDSTNVALATPMVPTSYSAKGCFSDLSEDHDPAPESSTQGTNGACTPWR
ncbi:YjfA family protein [Streptomyces sp. NBC_00464]|uniref:DUF2690 domain-containing protein n=1 Tax=Streptomyces sp. NBC_00464 TaxID=2975751 RepID=UPI002E187885